MKIFSLTEGSAPLIISVPHAGTEVPGEIAARFTPQAAKLPDTDWHVDRLYENFADAHDVTVIKAHYSRYVIDLNRPPDDAALYPGQMKLGLCPDKMFDGQDIYKPGAALDEQETARRLESFWRPYHDALSAQIDRLRAKHGYVFLYDAHSIRSQCPQLFKGRLPDLNLGTDGGKSCAPEMAAAALEAAQKSGYSHVLNGRFTGGYITRHYGKPAANVHALQMELAQLNYMDEDSFAFDPVQAGRLRVVLESVLVSSLGALAEKYTPSRTTA